MADRFDSYAAQVGQWFAELMEHGHNVGIDLRFTERIAADSVASERASTASS